MISGNHTARCRAAEARRKLAQERYDKRWPQRCAYCLTHTDSEHPCQHCLSNYYTCPRCNRKDAMDSDDATIPCKYCGFDENDPADKRPEDHKCTCRVAEEAFRQRELTRLRRIRDQAQDEIDRLLEARR